MARRVDRAASGGWIGQILAMFDPRGLRYFSFGLALYLTVLFRACQQ